MTYRSTLSYLYSQLPMFQRIGAAAYKADLKNTISLCRILDNPERNFHSIHIAGTNGKGSVSHLLAAVLQSAGYKVGLFTSPHLKDFRERIRIDGRMIPKEKVIRFVQKHKKSFNKIKPSFFEWTAVLAFDHFSDQQVDIAILETGMGGRLDSTNVVNPLLSVITNVSLDHQQYLGRTLKKIAAEKAGIIKKEGLAVISEYQKETAEVFEKKARKENATLVYTKNFKPDRIDYPCGLKGIYQKKNIPTVILCAALLKEIGFDIDPGHLAKGLKEVVKLTGIRGRWEVIGKRPTTIVDIAHNSAALMEIFKQARKVPHKKLHVVFGMVNDKDTHSILNLLPRQAVYYFCNANQPRSLEAKVLAQKAGKCRLNGNAFESVKKAVSAAHSKARNGDLVLITGSAFVVAEA